jgi:hypothetical protein
MVSVRSEMDTLLDFVSGSIKKEAGFFSIGDVIVCLNPIEPVVKGEKYRVTGMPKPGYLAIEDMNGVEIGAFQQSRFCQDNNEY